MDNPCIGEIRMVGFNFAPVGWALCNGQLLAISSNTALFSLLGTLYGGDGRTTFGLPDLRGRVPIGSGQGPGLPFYPIGARSGAIDHTHGVTTSLGSGTELHTHEVGGVAGGAGLISTSAGSVDDTSLASATTQSEQHLPPYLSINFVIALQGIYPTRS